MPRAADPNVRIALIEAAARILAEEGAGRLTLRRVANEVGTSTMAVYTHFGGMDDLRRAVRKQGFERLAEHLADAAQGPDPVVRLLALGGAYLQNAVDNPHLYRAMFVDHSVDEADSTVGFDTFLTLVEAVADCVAAGRFRPADAEDLATQLWMGIHGAVTLQLAGLVPADRTLAACLDFAINLF